jgi:hypothetical protein
VQTKEVTLSMQIKQNKKKKKNDCIDRGKKNVINIQLIMHAIVARAGKSQVRRPRGNYKNNRKGELVTGLANSNLFSAKNE